MRGRRPHKLRPRIGPEAPHITALGVAEPSGSFRMLGPVTLQQLLEVAAEFDTSFLPATEERAAVFCVQLDWPLIGAGDFPLSKRDSKCLR